MYKLSMCALCKFFEGFTNVIFFNSLQINHRAANKIDKDGEAEIFFVALASLGLGL